MAILVPDDREHFARMRKIDEAFSDSLKVGERIDEEIRQEITENRKADETAKQMITGIDGAFVKGRPPTDRANLESAEFRSRPPGSFQSRDLANLVSRIIRCGGVAVNGTSATVKRIASPTRNPVLASNPSNAL
jgi:hypothetical protein